jgi:hypothetical protein
MNRMAQAFSAVFLLVSSAVSVDESTCQEKVERNQRPTGMQTEDDSVSLMQVQQQVVLSASKRGAKGSNSWTNEGSCSDLTNQGAYFTIPVGVGTPEQTFNLVADTGSDALIVPDCRCVTAGYCDQLKNCFSAERSTSFGLDMAKGQTPNSVAVMGAKMNYGSGQIQVLVASEHVRVAGSHAQMHNGVFLMEDRRSLNVHGDFEGILGLGLPHTNAVSKEGVKIPSFFDASEARRYTLCFNEYPDAGTLRVGMSHLPHPMTNIGTVHWGLDLHGFSVGDTTQPILFCSPAQKAAGQTTACGAIPDSGTTLMMGPKDHIRKLYAALCDQWPRCQNHAQQVRKGKDEAFHDLLAECENWLTEDQGVNEVPSVFIHLAGSEGKAQAVELSAWAYIVETNQEVYKVVTTKLFGAVPVQAAVDTGKKKKICTASFGPQEYNTAQNGPVWIMGAPMFYASTVGYDIGNNGGAKMAFIEGACTPCSGNQTSLLSSDVTAHRSKGHHVARRQRSLRRTETIREPDIDTTQPL